MQVVSLSTLFLWSKPIESVIDVLIRKMDADEGPDAWDLIDDESYGLTKDNLKKYSELACSGIKYTVHCPLTIHDYIHPDRSVRKRCVNILKDSMLNAVELSPLTYVFHPAALPTRLKRDDVKDLNFEFVEEIYSYAKSIGLNVLIENHVAHMDFMMNNIEEFDEFYRKTNSSIMMAYDVGHANIDGKTKEFVDRFRNRIGVLHAHDNDGRADLHLAIGDGNIDWYYIVKRLKERDFQGPFIVESIYDPFKSVKILRKILSDTF
ncbi:MAG: sugar phosphate isomerase/epimerase [Nitrososphaeria archaeon]